MGQITGRDMANRWVQILKKPNARIKCPHQLAALPPSQDSHCLHLHCQPCVSIFVEYCFIQWHSCSMKIIFRYDYVTYPVWYLAQKPWRTKRVQRSIHSKWEVLNLFAQHSWNLLTNLAYKEPENGEVVYHSIVEPTAVNRDLRRYNLNTIEKVWFVESCRILKHLDDASYILMLLGVVTRCGQVQWQTGSRNQRDHRWNSGGKDFLALAAWNQSTYLSLRCNRMASCTPNTSWATTNGRHLGSGETGSLDKQVGWRGRGYFWRSKL